MCSYFVMESLDYWIIRDAISSEILSFPSRQDSQAAAAACRLEIKCGQPRRAAQWRPAMASRPPVAIVISYFWNCEKLCDCMSWGSCRGEERRGGGQSVGTECKVQPQPKPYQILFTIHMPPPLSGFTNGHFSVREAPRISSQTPGMKKCWGPSCHILIFHKNQECHCDF